MSEELFSVWDGVYNSFAEAGGDFKAFDSDIWINKQKERINTSLEQLKSNNLQSRDYPLPIIAAMELQSKQNLNILDFGGGMGLHYIELIAKVPEADTKVKFYVVDKEATINSSPQELLNFSNLKFCSDLNQINSNVDIIHIGSTLQYIEDWPALLQLLVKKFNPKYFVFSDIFAGDISSFITHQIFYNYKIPHVFINIDEFYNEMIKINKYKLLFKTKFVRKILDQDKIFPNHGLPSEYRIDRPYNLVFSRHE